MKSFIEHLNESQKTYTFKVGVAGDVPEGFDDRLESSLRKFSIKNMTPGKRTPIQEKPLDFPNLQNMEVTYYEIELAYPTTQQVLEEYIGQCTGVHRQYVRVFDPESREISKLEISHLPSDKAYVAALESDYVDRIGTNDAQNEVGGNRVMDLLKELEKARKERPYDPTDGGPREVPQKTIDDQNTESVLGSK
jgi:hypothetical protein